MCEQDGFARVDPDYYDAVANDYRKTNWAAGGSRMSNDTELDGANVWLWDYLSSLGNFTVTYEIHKLPKSMLYANATVIIQYLFDLGYDCILTATTLSPDKYPYMSFLTPHQPFGMIVVAQSPVATGSTVSHLLSSWADPFDRQVWAIVATLLGFSAVAMLFFEYTAQNHEDFGPEYLHWTRRLGRGFYKCMVSYTMTGSFEPMTPAGRFYSVVFSFVVLLVQSAYTANLAAFFTHVNFTTQLVGSVDTLVSFSYNACVQAGSEDIDWVASRYPSIKMVQVNATSTLGVIDALDSGYGGCQAAIVPDQEAYYALGVADTGNNYCTLAPVGSSMGAFYYAIPINRNSSVIGAAEMSALNSLVVEAISYGEYDMGTSDDNFQQSRSAPCQQILNSAASNNDGNIPSLSFQQMAGVFFIQACGLFFSLIIHFTLSSRGLKGYLMRRQQQQQRENGDKDEEALDNDGEPETEGVRLKRNMKEIPLNAMLNIDNAMQRAMQQLQTIQEHQRAIDLLYTMQEQQSTPAHHASVPLHVMAKMDRAVGFGLHAKASLLLLDGRNQIMAKLSYVMNESAELSQAFLKMSEEDAMEFDSRVTEFLRAKTEEMRRRRAGNGMPGRGGPMLLGRPPPAPGSNGNGSMHSVANGGGGGGGGGGLQRAQTASGASGGGGGRPFGGMGPLGGRAQTQAIPRTRVNS